MNAAHKASNEATSVTSDPRWSILINRRADSDFLYSVATTGVYCRPDCSSRLPRPENVRFHDSCRQAEAAGFRPCKRCRPNRETRQADLIKRIETACRLIEQSEEELTLAQIARQVNMSQFHFHRTFKSTIGLTPKAYGAAVRNKRVRNKLTSGACVTEAIFAAGYKSSSRFYERAQEILGMAPSRFRAGGKEETIHYAIGDSDLGKVLVAHSQLGICAIFLGNDIDSLLDDLVQQFPLANCAPADEQYQQSVETVIEHLNDPTRSLELPLDIRGTAFQQKVWNALRDIAPGTTASYSEVAKRIGKPNAARAVAKACAGNTIAVAIPCHRVIRSDGTLCGYRWGEDRKRELLTKEKQ